MSDEVYLARKPEFYASYLDRFERLDPPLLELGAGHGLFLTLAAQRGIEACGVEIVKERVEICREKGLDVLEHDLGEPLPYADASFGMIYCGQVIEHMAPGAQRVMLREAFRVLRPGGQFQVRSPCRHYEPARLQPGHDHLLTPSELQTMLREAGFNEIEMDLNYPQEVPEIPTKVLADIWSRYRPDLLSQTASAFCIKGSATESQPKPLDRRRINLAKRFWVGTKRLIPAIHPSKSYSASSRRGGHGRKRRT